jgi:radical SAM protein with 4Fe4S-binding SPASM domain
MLKKIEEDNGTEFKRKIKKKYLLCQSLDDLNKSPVFCMAPWIHIHLMPNGNIIPCCNASYHVPFGNANNNKLIEIWNSFQYKKLRAKMILGIKSDICTKCYEDEAVKKHSFRMYFNECNRKDFGLVKKTSYSGHLEMMNIRYFDIRFSNACNFKCRGCGPPLSSSWSSDFEKLFDLKLPNSNIINCTEKGTNHIWEQLTTLIPNAHEVFFAGGEPLIMEEHYKAFEILLENKRKNLKITYVTNFSIIKFKQYDIFELWKHFKIINLNVSVDDIGKRGEYYRKGMKWENLVNNLNIVKEKVPHVNLSIMMTVNMMNVFYIPEVYRFFIENKYVKTNKFNFILLKEPVEYNIQVAPLDFKNKIREKLTDSITELKTAFPYKNFGHYIYNIKTILDFLFKKDYPVKCFEDFQSQTKKLDVIRNENFAEVHPEIAFLME